MNLILTNAGSYPRIGDIPEKQLLRKTISQWEKGEKTAEELTEAENALTKAAIDEQIEAGLQLVTDGQIRWYDQISHIAGKLHGVNINGLLRFFDTNCYFRQPVVTIGLQRTKPIIVEEFRFAQAVSSRPVKPVITGPYTLAKFSIIENGRYKNFERLVEDYAIAVADEIKALVGAGADIVQVDEPAILQHREDFDVFSAALRTLFDAKGSAKLALYTYFGDVGPLYARFQELPVDIHGLDFTYSENLIEMIVENGSRKPLALGLIDGRNTKMENENALCDALEKLLPAIKADFSYLNPSCGFEYLPRDRAFLKLKNMAKIAARFLL